MNPIMSFGGGSRPWLRRIALVLAVLLALTALAWGSFHLWASHRLERARLALLERAGAATPEELAPPPVAEAIDAYPLIRRAGRALPEPGSPEADLALELVSLAPGSLPAPELLARWDGVRDEHSGAFELLQRAARRPAAALGLDYARGTHRMDFSEELLPLMRQARLLAADARVAAARIRTAPERVPEAEAERLEASLAALRTLSALFHREPTVVTQLVGQAVDRLLLGGLAEAVLALPSERIQTLEEYLPEDPRPGLQRAFYMDAASSLALAKEPGGEGETAAPEAEGLLTSPMAEVWMAEMVDLHLELARVVPLPRAERMLALEREMAQDGWRRPFHPLVIPNYLDALEKATRGEASRRLVTLALELIRRGGETGSYPPTLQALPVPEELRTDPTTGEPVEWRVGPGGTGHLEMAGALEVWRRGTAGRGEEAAPGDGPQPPARGPSTRPLLELDLPPLPPVATP